MRVNKNEVNSSRSLWPICERKSCRTIIVCGKRETGSTEHRSTARYKISSNVSIQFIPSNELTGNKLFDEFNRISNIIRMMWRKWPKIIIKNRNELKFGQQTTDKWKLFSIKGRMKCTHCGHSFIRIDEFRDLLKWDWIIWVNFHKWKKDGKKKKKWRK